jgi:hypothetical protein
MKWKSVVSLVLSAASICAQTIGLSYASLAATAVASGGRAPAGAVQIADCASFLAMILAPAAVLLAAVAWPRELPWVRVLVLCLAAVAVLWSLVMV